MMMMRMNWKTTGSTDERYVYLTVMRDLKQYCAKGYCEIEICFYHFVTLPQSYVKRRMAEIAPTRFKKHFTIDWQDRDSVLRFYRLFITLLCQLNSLVLNLNAFDEAFSEFSQYLTKGKNAK